MAAPISRQPAPLSDTRVGRRWLPELLVEALASTATPGRPLRTLDCGGGTGALAVPLAAAGVQVTVVDRSADALALLARRADEAAVGPAVTAVLGDLDAPDLGLADLGLADPGPGFDLVVVHDVLTALADPEATLRAAVARCADGGWFSLQVVNQAALVLGRALAGDVAGATVALDHPTRGSYDVPALLDLMRRVGLEPGPVHGVGLLTEYVAGPDLEAHGASAAALAALESRLAALEPYREIASRVHVLARRTRPAG